MDLRQLTSEGGATNLERQVPALTGRGLADVGATGAIRLLVGFAVSFDGDAHVFPLPIFQDSPLVSMFSRIG